MKRRGIWYICESIIITPRRSSAWQPSREDLRAGDISLRQTRDTAAIYVVGNRRITFRMLKTCDRAYSDILHKTQLGREIDSDNKSIIALATTRRRTLHAGACTMSPSSLATVYSLTPASVLRSPHRQCSGGVRATSQLVLAHLDDFPHWPQVISGFRTHLAWVTRGAGRTDVYASFFKAASLRAFTPR